MTGVQTCALPIFMGSDDEEAEILLNTSLLWRYSVDVDATASYLKNKVRMHLSNEDFMFVSRKVARYHRNRLKKVQKVYLALREIGKPSHFSIVTEMFAEMFPEDIRDDYNKFEHNILALLGRGAYGIVWIGVKGTYALEEWGFERPSKTLFDLVTMIVTERYEETNKPVPFTIILSEAAKHRRIIKASSLTIASHCNSAIKKVGADSFIPRDPDEIKEETETDELYVILEGFVEEQKELNN